MARTVQAFTRLDPEQFQILKDIGTEMIDEGGDQVALRNHQGEINTSEVIRVLLARADRRLL